MQAMGPKKLRSHFIFTQTNSKLHNGDRSIRYSNMKQLKYKTVLLVFLCIFAPILILWVYQKSRIKETLISPVWGSCMLLAAGIIKTVCPLLKQTNSTAVATRYFVSPEVLLQSDSVLQTFDECVSAGGSDCAPEKLWLQIPFFCGHYSECW